MSDDQRKLVAENDRKLKNEYLAAAPHITHGTVKNNAKYQAYMTMVKSSTK